MNKVIVMPNNVVNLFLQMETYFKVLPISHLGVLNKLRFFTMQVNYSVCIHKIKKFKYVLNKYFKVCLHLRPDISKIVG